MPDEGLPLLTVPAPPERFHRQRGQRHKTLLDWSRQMLRQLRRWLPERRIIVVSDGSFAALEFLASVRRHVSVITRLRLDASLFAPAPPRCKGQIETQRQWTEKAIACACGGQRVLPCPAQARST